MPFSSNLFLIGFLPWMLLLFCLVSRTNHIGTRKAFIGACNLVFYLWGGIQALEILLGLVLLTWLAGQLLYRFRKRLILLVSCSILLLPLAVMKYSGFLLSSFILPLGISFFTFEAISCICDVYHGSVQKAPSLLDIYLYLSFFVTVTSGPILRIGNFLDGMNQAEAARKTDAAACLERIFLGLCKKVLLADKIAMVSDLYFEGMLVGYQYSGVGLWVGAIAYALQLYFDFSGYSDMAIGIGALMGFSIPENFNHPYQAKSIQDFWKRWHITLSQWFRDYVYIPLGGSRCSSAQNIFNLCCVWLLTGIWHGADWSFLAWGVGHLILLILEKYVTPVQKLTHHWIGHFYTMFFVILLWVPFRAQNIHVASQYLQGMFRFNHHWMQLEAETVRSIPFLTFAALACTPLAQKIADCSQMHPFLMVLRKGILIAISMLALSAVIGTSYAPCIYGAF